MQNVETWPRTNNEGSSCRCPRSHLLDLVPWVTMTPRTCLLQPRVACRSSDDWAGLGESDILRSSQAGRRARVSSVLNYLPPPPQTTCRYIEVQAVLTHSTRLSLILGTFICSKQSTDIPLPTRRDQFASLAVHPCQSPTRLKRPTQELLECTMNP